MKAALSRELASAGGCLRLEGQTQEGEPQRGKLEGKGMRETEQKPAWAEHKPVGREERGRVHDKEDSRGADEVLTIPDYVMRDFGLSAEDEKEDHGSGIRA